MALIPILDIAGKVLDRVLPDAKERDAAKLELLRLEQNGELEDMKVQLSAILAEAQSNDPWTSRARPAFMYVIYFLILFGVPMGIVSAFSADASTRIADGFGAWLRAIPSDFVTLFGIGYLGYTGARSVDKWRGKGKKD